MGAFSKDPLVFFVNGKKVVEPRPDPEWTLLQYLRDKLRLCGTRPACKEGGCGACTVLLSKWDPNTQQIRNAAINACLAPLCTLHGAAIVTVEGLGSVQKGLHPVHERIAKSHGTQCGYCTPGFVMSMYALLRNNPMPTERDMELAFQGNFCRCTGYRPILDGLKSFCQAENCCRKANKGSTCQESTGIRAVSDILVDESEFKPYDPTQDPIFPPELKLHHENYQKPLVFQSDRVQWFHPTTLQMVLELKQRYPEGRLIAGGNDLSYERKPGGGLPRIQIHVPEVPEITQIRLESGHLVVGSRVTFGQLLSFCQQHQKENLLFDVLSRYLLRLGDCQLRNTATIGGSIFGGAVTSDSITLFAAAGATVELLGTSGTTELELDDKFFKPGGGTTVTSDKIMTALRIPLLQPDEFLWASKVSQRKDVAAAILNAAFKVKFSDPKQFAVSSSKFVFNGLATGGITFATSYSSSCNGRPLTQETLEALKSAPRPFVQSPLDPQISPSYRTALVHGLFDRFYDDLLAWKVDKPGASEVKQRETTQLYEIVPDDQPRDDLVGRPIAHLSSLKHATGEAVYLADIPPYSNELFGSIVMSTHTHAKILSVNYEPALSIPGVLEIFDWRSVGEDENRYATVFVPDESLFAKDEVCFNGQPIAFVVAETQDAASRAAKAVQIEYEDKLPLLLTIDDAVRHGSFFERTSELKQGNAAEAFARSDRIIEGEMHIGGQKHFYMETNGSIAIPHEDGAVEIITTTQAPKSVQDFLRSCLGLKSNEVIVKMRRTGGGFGGKAGRTSCVIVYTALAAKKLGRPVRCVLSREEDSLLVGGRHPVLGRYKVGFSNNGSMNAIQAEIFLDGGHSLDVSPLVLDHILGTFLKMYKVPNLDLCGRICRTNTSSYTAFRGFGKPQAALITENIIDDIALALNKTPEEIRQKHFYKDGDIIGDNQFTVERSTIQRCWDELMVQAEVEGRRKAIEEFNRSNAAKKRGMAVTTASFPLGFPIPFMNQSGALVMIYDDGSVFLNHGGCEMGQGIHTKMMQVASRVLGVPISKIRVADTASDKVPNTSKSAGSTTTDLNGPAVIDACEILLERLEPIKAMNPNGTWEEWIRAAYFNRINLSATGYCKLEFPGKFKYMCYGAGVTEVEIDCRTGEHQILRTDIVMDVGESLNPAIDIGQIEGSYMQAAGLVTIEEQTYHANGQLLSTGPGNYKCPMVSDAPRVFNVSLLRGAPNPNAVYSSKATGEPAMLLVSSVFFAIKDAIRAARVEKGLSPVFRLDSPATVQRIKLAIEAL